MVVLAAYISVVFIWATTPLAIQWSSDTIGFSAAVLLRMSLALALGLLINALLRRQLFQHSRAWKIYLAGAIGIFPNMPVVYWSEQYIPSGLVAVIFAMSPFTTGLMTFLLLKKNPFTLRHSLALLIALLGLVIIFYQQIQLGPHAVYGIMGMLVSCFLFSFSSVLIKKINMDTAAIASSHVPHPDAFNQALGALLFSLPGLVVVWWLLDGSLPAAVSAKSLVAVSYLSIFGSLLGSTLFFLVLGHMSASAVSLITFITPTLALMIGTWIGGESLTWQLWLGVSLIVFALLAYTDFFSANGFFNALNRCSWREDPLVAIKNERYKFK